MPVEDGLPQQISEQSSNRELEPTNPSHDNKPWRRRLIGGKRLFIAGSALAVLAGLAGGIMKANSENQIPQTGITQTTEVKDFPEFKDMNDVIVKKQEQIEEKVADLHAEFPKNVLDDTETGFSMSFKSKPSEKGEYTTYGITYEGKKDALGKFNPKDAEFVNVHVIHIGKTPENESLLYSFESDKKKGYLQFNYFPQEQQLLAQYNLPSSPVGVTPGKISDSSDQLLNEIFTAAKEKKYINAVNPQ